MDATLRVWRPDDSASATVVDDRGDGDGVRARAAHRRRVLGESGVGKSGLAMVLAGEEFKPTESTHGRQIWRLPASEPGENHAYPQ